MQLSLLEGKRIEIILEGRHIIGRVVRGPGRKAIFLEERGAVGDNGDRTLGRLSKLRIWKEHQLSEAELVQILSRERPPLAAPKKERAEWVAAVEYARGDPKTPPDSWQKGQLAWAEAVHAARRQVDRSRKAMMRALREAAN